MLPQRFSQRVHFNRLLDPLNTYYYVNKTCYKSKNYSYLLLLHSVLGYCCLAGLGNMNIWKACIQRCPTRALGGTLLTILWLSSVLPGKCLDRTSIDPRPLHSQFF